MADGSEPSPDDEPSQGGLRGFLRRLMPPKPVGLDDVLHDGTGNGVDLSASERAMIERIIAFDDKRVEDVAIPRADIVGVPIDADLQDILKTFSEANHSRLPVYRGDLDDPVGMVHIKDVVGLLAASDDVVPLDPAGFLSRIKREILYVPPSMPVTDLLLRMQASRVHMALVIDEYGGTDGLVTIEDLIELIVGDIRDEHDEADDFVLKRLGENSWEADARAPLEDLADLTGHDIRLPEEEADTLGGLVLNLAGRIPLRGEVVVHPSGYELDVVDADARSVRRIVLRYVGRPEGDESDPDKEPVSAAVE
ncbi:MAG: hemolysin family protein [Parvularcula sp.]